MTLPTAADVHRLAFSPARYGKQPHRDNESHSFWYGGRRLLRGGPPDITYFEDDENENGREVYGYSKHSERSLSQGHDGALEQMSKLPDDILYEIFSHLHPTDVLSLSRANRFLRDILHEKHGTGRVALLARQCWAFDDWCHFCLAPGVENISWVCRVRCCEKCLKKQFISHDELDLWLPENLYVEHPDLIFPYFMARQKREGRHKPMYFLPTAREYLRELNYLANDATLAEWSQKKKEKQALRVQHAGQCEYWHTHWAFRASYKASPSYLWELALVVWLSILLMGLWRDKFMEVMGRFKAVR